MTELDTMLAQYSSPYAPRGQQAEKILAILDDFLDADLSHTRCLDVGCATGTISAELAHHCDELIGIDIDATLLHQARNQTSHNIVFVLTDGTQFPIPGCSIDIVICAQVYEHAPNPSALAEEIWRVLRPGGVCFFSGPNKLAVIEEHYWLPFLSWLPEPLANAYMQVFRRGNGVYDIAPLTSGQLRTLWNRFEIHDYSLRLIQNPEQFAMQDKFRTLHWIQRLPAWMLKVLMIFIPNYNWILVK